MDPLNSSSRLLGGSSRGAIALLDPHPFNLSTKYREPLVTAQVEPGLHSYMAGILRKKRCPALTIGGTPDHVHVLFLLARTISVSEVVEDLKKDSSRWIKTQGASFGAFSWQEGYGAFSIGQSGVEARRYIDNQKEHHRVRTFQDEFRAFLKKYEMECRTALVGVEAGPPVVPRAMPWAFLSRP